MLRALKFVPDVEVEGPDVGLVRRALRVVLLRAADRAVKLAVRLEADAAARAPADVVPAVRPYAPAGALGVKLVEAVAVLAVAAYFVVGLVGVFAA